MKLKFELIYGYGVLVDEKAEINKGDYVTYQRDGLCITKIINTFESHRTDCNKIIFAEKELGLDVPVFEWRDFKIGKLAEKSSELQKVSYTIPHAETYKHGFIDGYKSNTAKYTGTDMLIIRNKLVDFLPVGEVSSWDMIQAIKKYTEWLDEYLDSIQKHPKYVVMENEDMEFGVEKEYSPKLFTNSEGKQQGILKELIWD